MSFPQTRPQDEAEARALLRAAFETAPVGDGAAGRAAFGGELLASVRRQSLQPLQSRHGRPARWARVLVPAGAAMVIAGGLLAAGHGTGRTTASTAASPASPASSASSKAPKARTTAGVPASGNTNTETTANGTLMSLAASVTASSALPGNASLVITDQTIGGTRHAPEYFIYADNGSIYSAQAHSGLPAAVADQDTYRDAALADEVNVARHAATGSLSAAQVKMVDDMGGSYLGLGRSPAQRQKLWAASEAARARDYEAKGATPPPDTGPPAGQALADKVGNLIWNGSLEALATGGGNPEVKAGVLRLLATVPGVTVTKSVTGGQATLTLTAGPEVFAGMGSQVLTVDAMTGSPVKLFTPAGNGAPSSAETYQVSRVTLADVAKGKF